MDIWGTMLRSFIEGLNHDFEQGSWLAITLSDVYKGEHFVATSFAPRGEFYNDNKETVAEDKIEIFSDMLMGRHALFINIIIKGVQKQAGTFSMAATRKVRSGGRKKINNKIQ